MGAVKTKIMSIDERQIFGRCDNFDILDEDFNESLVSKTSDIYEEFFSNNSTIEIFEEAEKKTISKNKLTQVQVS